MNLRCIHCGYPIKTLFVQYSPGNIRLMKCDNCQAIADEYIECEIMILLIDLMLHKQKAYRHLLHNTLNRDTRDVQGALWKSSSVYFLLEACRNLLLKTNMEDEGLSRSSLSSIWSYEKMLVNVLLVNFIFLGGLLLLARTFLKDSYQIISYKDLFLAIIISSYLKTFVIAMMVWEFPSSVLFIVDMLVLSSNVVALKVVTRSKMTRCIWVCAIAHAMKFLINSMLEIPSVGCLR